MNREGSSTEGVARFVRQKVARSLENQARGEAIESFFETAHMMRDLRIRKTWRLLHENGFLNISMQECIVNIELPNRPAIGKSNGKNNAYGGGLYHRAESFFT